MGRNGDLGIQRGQAIFGRRDLLGADFLDDLADGDFGQSGRSLGIDVRHDQARDLLVVAEFLGHFRSDLLDLHSEFVERLFLRRLPFSETTSSAVASGKEEVIRHFPHGDWQLQLFAVANDQRFVSLADL